jgi:hypothetical protein
MKRKGIWLGVAVVLLALSALLMSRGDKEKPTARPPKMEFPHHPKPEENVRNQKRRTLPPLRAESDDEEGYRMKRDPMLVALPTDPKRSAMVFELEALKEAPIMQVWLDCMLARSDRRRSNLNRFKDRFGLDPLADIERVAVSSDKLMVMQGAIDKAKLDELGWSKRTYGEKGVIYEDPESGRVVGTWGGEMMMLGDRSEEDATVPIEDAIDRLESDDPEQKSILSDSQAYGDVYGVLSPEDLAKMLPGEQAALAEKIKKVVEHVDLHADASDDVAMTADVSGLSEEDMEDLSKSFGAALAVGRIKAQNDGDEKLAELLDYAKVKPRGSSFSVDVALPFELLSELGPCKKDDRDSDEDAPPPRARAAPADKPAP